MWQGSRTALSEVFRLSLVGVGYFAAAYLGLQLASINPSATPIWPATGLAIAATMLWGYRVAPAIFLAAFVVNNLTAGSPFTSAIIALGNTLEAVATAYFVRRWAESDHVFHSATGVGKFALICTVTTTISATIGVAALVVAGFAPPSNAAAIWLTWWLGDFAGAVVVTPVALLWLSGDLKLRSPGGASKCVGTYLGAVAVGMIAFSPLIQQTPLRDPLGFLAVAPLLWAALRCGPRDTATVAAILAGFAVWGTMMQGGPFARATLNESFLLLLMFMISTSIPSLALSADLRARQRAQEHQLLLLRELSHRVGNTLAVLGSVFRRSARHAQNIAELEQAFQGRLMNLAATHRLLGEANWESASVGDLVKAATEPYCSPEYERCEFSGADTRIPGQIVTSLTMVLHELASNAAKHGALKSKGGKLKVAWRQEKEGDTSQLHLNWEEAGLTVRSEEREAQAGYGTALIDTTVGSLGGKLERLLGERELSVRIVIPLCSSRKDGNGDEANCTKSA
jgi:two-component sensor histidine kinase/integral membrane sensor domain MASE1